jgi:decaprenylphosphoryl-5-phosphoribose phosphatase
MRRRGHQRVVERAVLSYSRLGEHSRLWFALAGAGVVTDGGHRETYGRLVRVLVAAELTNAVAKRVFRRKRPVLPGLPPLMGTRSNLSFPSAHACTSFAAARILSGPMPPATAYTMAVAMAASRPYLGVHYPSDVAAGAILGTALVGFVP